MTFHGDTQDGHPTGWFNPDTEEWDAAQPVLPYGSGNSASSGHSGGATSRERAERADRDGTTAARQNEVYLMLWDRRARGATWKEVAQQFGWHHGQASGALSNLHKVGRIARLTERRERCFVYTLPEYVNGRGTQAQGRKAHLTDEEERIVRAIADVVTQGWTPPRGYGTELIRIIERLTGEKFLLED